VGSCEVCNFPQSGESIYGKPSQSGSDCAGLG